MLRCVQAMLSPGYIFGITFLYIIFGLPMNTFLYTGAVKAIPEALDEAAMIDGANPIQIFSRIIFPVLKPTTATVAILSFMWTWNDFYHAIGTVK